MNEYKRRTLKERDKLFILYSWKICICVCNYEINLRNSLRRYLVFVTECNAMTLLFMHSRWI